MKDRVFFIVKIIALVDILITGSYYWLSWIILHIGAGLRYGCLRLIRRGRKVSYKHIRYGSDDFSDIDHADNNLANGFLGVLVFAVILILIVNK